MPPVYGLTTPSQHPVITLVDNAGNPFNYDPDAVSSGHSTIPRYAVSTAGVVTVTQNLRLTYFTATKNETVTQARVISGTTAAAATPTLIRIGLYLVAANGDITLVASTPNDTTLLAATSTVYTKALSSPYAMLVNSRYAAGLLVVTAVAAPTVAGHNALNVAEAAIEPRLGGLVGGQADLPASVVAASISNSSQLQYIAFTP